MGTYKVKEDGRNGVVEVLPDRIVRTVKKTLGRDDHQTIPLKAIHEVRIDRKMLGSSTVRCSAARSTLPSSGVA